MNKLHNFYKKWTQIIVLTLCALSVAIAKWYHGHTIDAFKISLKDDLNGKENLNKTEIERLISQLEKPDIDDSWVYFIFAVATSSIFFTLLYLGAEYLIRTYFWKHKFLNRDIDFSGKWLGWSFYTDLEIESKDKTRKDFQPFHSKHAVVIEQDCLNARIESSPGTEFVNWHSIAFNITENKSLRFAYEVSYEGSDRLAGEAIGYEQMDVIKKGDGKFPILLSGTFYHCATGNKPIYRGRTIFVRDGYGHLINKDDLPGFAEKIFDELKTTSA